MSDSEVSQDSLSDWTVVKRVEEVADADSESSESSIEVVSFEGQDAVSFRCTLQSISLQPDEGGEVKEEEISQVAVPCSKVFPFTDQVVVHNEVSPCTDQVGVHSEVSPCTDQMVVPSEVFPCSDHVMLPSEMSPCADQVIETDGGRGACCMEMTMMSAANKNVDELQGRNEEAPCSVDGRDSSISNINADLATYDNVNDDSDEESDFICLDANSVDDLAANHDMEDSVAQFPRVVIMDRNRNSSSVSSIGPSFNFFRQRDPVQHHDDDFSDRDSMADLDDDTESSVGDAIDDRIESEQSEAGSIQAQNDIGDLSTFADIGDLPLEVGNVARNYIHRPNNRLSTVLNVTVVLAAILTMGMSLGIIMAGDLEIEEWQRAYEGQVKKTVELENRLLKAEARFAGFEDVLTAYAATEISGKPVVTFVGSMKSVLNDFKKCGDVSRQQTFHECQATILDGIHKSFSDLKRTLWIENKQSMIRSHSTFDTDRVSLEEISLEEHAPNPEMSNVDIGRQNQKVHSGFKDQTVGNIPKLDVKQLQQSLTLEQERALHWQQLYLRERRQRERERENEELEDQRDRQLWEKEDEEEDRLLRQQWEKEEEEEDRKDRLNWEKEEAEEDKRDRERWEREKTRITFDECVKVMSANLSGLAQHVFKWNTTRLHDFANLSMLMSSVADLKQSVVESVKQLRKSTEASWNQEKQEDMDAKNEEESLFNQETVARYLKGALTSLKSEVDNIFNINDDKDDKSEIPDEPLRQSAFQDDGDDFTTANDDGNEPNNGMWQKAFNNLFKITRKSIRTFGRGIAHSWKHLKSALKGKKNHNHHHHQQQQQQQPQFHHQQFHHQGEEKEVPKTSFLSLVQSVCPSLYGRLKKPINEQSVLSTYIDIESQCVKNVRRKWHKDILKRPCQVIGKYSYACNTDHGTLKKEIKHLQKSLWKLMIKDNVEPSEISGHRPKVMRKKMEKFQAFWDTWGHHDLLMRPDRNWLKCRMKLWSDNLMGKDALSDELLCKTVCLHVLFEVIMEKGFEGTFVTKPLGDTGMLKGKQSNEMKQEKELRNLDHDNRFKDFHETSEDTLKNYKHEVIHVSGVGTGRRLMKHNEDKHEDYIDEDDDDDGIYILDEDDSRKAKTGFLSPFENINTEDIENNTHILRSDDDSDGYFESDWLLERAQNRLQLRRNREKNNWVFERASQREELRKQRADEISELFLQEGHYRKSMRERDHESDWIFDRARQRREHQKDKSMNKQRDKDSENIRCKQHRKEAEFSSFMDDDELEHQDSHFRHHFQNHENIHHGQSWQQKKWNKGKKSCNNENFWNKQGKGSGRNKMRKFRCYVKNILRHVFSVFFNPW